MDEEKKRFIERGSHKGKGIAVFTSGGDSQGKKEQYIVLFMKFVIYCMFDDLRQGFPAFLALKPINFENKLRGPLRL